MRRAACLVLVLLGPLPWLIVFATGLYLHSPLYRASIERDLSAYFELPTRVGRVVPLTWHERQLQDIEIFLPDEGGEPRPGGRVGYCRRADWLEGDSPGHYELAIYGGELDLSPARWREGDFAKIETSLRHDYSELGLDEARVHDSSVRWGRGPFHLQLGAAAGVIRFNGDPGSGLGVAELRATSLNGWAANVRAQAAFDPVSRAADALANGRGLVRRFELLIAEADAVPIAALQLDGLLGGPVTDGSISGRLSYVAEGEAGGERFTLSDGRLGGVDLGQLTHRLPGGPIAGRLDLDVGELRVERGAITKLRLSGDVEALALGGLLRLTGRPAVEGRIDLHLAEAELVMDGSPIRRLVAIGRVRDIDLAGLEPLYRQRLGPGKIRGLARADLKELLVEDGRLVGLGVELYDDPQAARAARVRNANTIDTELLKRAAKLYRPDLTERLAEAPLPERIHFRRLHVEAINAAANQYLLMAKGGDDGRSLLTLVVRSAEWLGAIELKAENVPLPAKVRELPGWLTEALGRKLTPIPLRAIGEQVRRHAATQPDAP